MPTNTTTELDIETNAIPSDPLAMADKNTGRWERDFEDEATGAIVRKFWAFDESVFTWRWATGSMAQPNAGGDTKHIWDSTKPVEVEAAKALFDTLRGKGYMVYIATGENGDKGDIIHEFVPTAERLIFVPPMQGG